MQRAFFDFRLFIIDERNTVCLQTEQGYLLEQEKAETVMWVSGARSTWRMAAQMVETADAAETL
mgnify:CR=1 FL=1